MSKFLKGELLIFTNKGLVRIDNLNKETHLILALKEDGSYYFDEIDEINKIYKNKYQLNKITFNNNIDNYLINDNIIIKSIQNIPNSIETPEICEYLSYNESRCKINAKTSELSSFDFIGFPTNINIENENKEEDNDYYRFQGLYISTNNFTTDITNKEIFDFIINYLNINNIKYVINDKNKIIINDCKKIVLNDLLKLNKEQLLIFTKSLIEITNEFNIKNKDDYYLIKYAYLLSGICIRSYYLDGYIQIKIPRKTSDSYYYYFNYNNNLYNKIRNIKKIVNNGFLYSLKLKNNNYYLTDIGFIS
jgi:hypothetical protein